jgi:lactaldehyde reductase
MAVAQYIAGMGFSNVGLGLVHGMAHPLGAYYDIPHGVANALLLPIVMEYNTESSIAKYVDIARAMGIKVDHLSLADAAQAAVDAVKNLAIEVGIPEKLQLLNVKEEDLERLSQSAFEDVCTPGNPREVQLGDILELYKKAF